MRLWLDTDIGRNPDDAVAVLVAVAHPAVDLVGLSITGDDPPAQADEAHALLHWAGRPEVPVFLPGGAPAAVAGAGADVVVGIGPLGNIAAALDAGARPADLVAMGGALRPVRHRGALREVEWNFSCDPAAAEAILARAPRCTLVPLDATVATRLDRRQLGRLVAAAPPLAPVVDRWLARLRAGGLADDEAAVHLHDPAAVLVAAGDGPLVGARPEPRRLTVDDRGRLVEHAGASPVSVVTALDGRAVADRVTALLAGSNHRP